MDTRNFNCAVDFVANAKIVHNSHDHKRMRKLLLFLFFQWLDSGVKNICLLGDYDDVLASVLHA